MNAMRPQRGLGRGLEALLGDAPAPSSAATDAAADATLPDRSAPGAARGETVLPVAFLRPNPDQPRRLFDEAALEELASSIRARGLLQPIIVRPTDAPDAYEIVAGERRWRAAQRAQLHAVPVIIRDLTDTETAEIALIENVQRVDLNSMEEAEAYARLASAYGRTQEEIARAVGKSRSHVANTMRLVELPPKTREALRNGVITAGHARALLPLDEADLAIDLVVKNRLSVRETEKFVKATIEARVKARRGEAPILRKPVMTPPAGKKDADTRALEADLAAALGLEVEIAHTPKGAGALTIRYRNLDQLDDVCRRLMGTGV